jgi:hypothetical protein
VSESVTSGPNAKLRRGAVGPVRSPFSAGLGASVGFLLPNLPLGIFWFAALVVLILLGILLAVVWLIVMAVTLAVLWLIWKPKWHMFIRGPTLIFAPTMSLCIRGAQVERRRVARFLGEAAPSAYRQLPQGSLFAPC